MKCIKNITTNEIKRVSDEIATSQVESGKFSFCGKSEWKKDRKPVPASLVAEVTVSAEDHAAKVARNARKAETKARSQAKKNGHKVAK